MKLAICLPALNEAAIIRDVLNAIPQCVPNFSQQKVFVVDDGSTDATAQIAQEWGATVVSHGVNRGTGRAFVSGVTAAIVWGADVVVCMDSDGQFDPTHISDLTQPIVEGKATVVLCTRFGARNLIGQMRWANRSGNWLLSTCLSLVAGRKFADVSCGFRAFTRDAALRIDIHSDFEYIHESLLIWSRCGQRIEEVGLPVLAQRPIGKSRIASSILRYAVRSGPVLVRAVRDYSPLKFFGTLSLATLIPGTCFLGIVTIHWLATGQTAPYTQMITLGVGGIVLSFLLAVLALIADLIARVKFQLDELVFESRRSRYDATRISNN